MYVTDLMKKLFKKKNIPALIYLILNVVIVVAVVGGFIASAGLNPVLSILLAVAVYVLTLALAISPFGEWIVRIQNKCRKIERADFRAQIQPLFDEVYAQARELDPSISEDVRLFYTDDEAPNAFATGRRTVCVTRGLMQLPEGQNRATLGHEFGHLAHKDTDLVLFIAIGNLIVNVILWIIMAVFWVLSLGDRGSRGGCLMAVAGCLGMLITSGIMWAWSKLGVLLVMKSSRENEFAADTFSCQLGYAREMCELMKVVGDSKAKGLFAALASSHPDKDARIANILNYGMNTGSAADVRQPAVYAKETESETGIEPAGRFLRK